MNVIDKRFFLAWLVVFVLWFTGAFVINVWLIDYTPLLPYLRPWEDELRVYHVLILADLILMAMFTFFYARLVQPQPWLGQGARYGLAAALFTMVPLYMRGFVAQPVPVSMLLQQLLYFIILMMLLGAVVAFMYRGVSRPA